VATRKGYDRFFPYDSTYPNQNEAMASIADALDTGQDILFEGSPGTGKTLAALVPALAQARRNDQTVVISTNVHQQMRQFINDAQAIAEENSIRAVVFKGKGSMCHIDVDYEQCQTLRDATHDLVEAKESRANLREQAGALADEIEDGSQEAASARTAVMDEIDSLNEEIEILESGNTCEYYRRNLVQSNTAFFKWLFNDVRTAEEIYEYAESRQVCGYELLKEGIEAVDLVICNYHHLLDPNIRTQFFKWLGKDAEQIITVFDEAHNIEAAAREHAGESLTERTLAEACTELDGVDDSRSVPALNVIKSFHTALEKTYDDRLAFGEREQIEQDWYDLSIQNENKRDALTLTFLSEYEGRGIDHDVEAAKTLGVELDAQYEERYRNGQSTTRSECQTLQAARFITQWLENDDTDQYPLVSVRQDEAQQTVYGRAELYQCLPRSVSESLFEEVYASILMSATLRPFDVIKEVLGVTHPETLAYGLAYPSARRRTLAVKAPALFSAERSDPEVQTVVSDVLADIGRYTPGNALAFFPSYREAARYGQRLQSNTAVSQSIYIDDAETDTESLKQSFISNGDAILCTSLWGTLTEGVSFDDDAARAVAVIGVGYPYLSERTKAIEAAYDRAYSNDTNAGWQYGVEIPTIRKTRQALGRVIRSPEDYGVLLLIDNRYTIASTEMGKYGVRDAFPTEERTEFVDIAPEKVKYSMLNFFQQFDAYNGRHPHPE